MSHGDCIEMKKILNILNSFIFKLAYFNVNMFLDPHNS